MANHHHIAEYFTEGVFFTEPGSPWQKPTVENTNVKRPGFDGGSISGIL